MSRRFIETCAEPGPYATHCTEDRGHRYSCYDASDDSSWNDRSPEDWQTETPHDCGDPECPDNPKPEAMTDRAADALLGLVETDRQLREPAGERHEWVRCVTGSDEVVEKQGFVSDGSGQVLVDEAFLAQLLLDAGWERAE